MKSLKILVATLLIFQISIGLFTRPTYGQFYSDIKGHIAEKTINEWIEKGLVSGYPDGTFKPNKTVTRAEFVKMMNKAFAKESFDQDKLLFSDVPEGHWAYEEVKTAIQHGFAKGTSSKTFSPDLSVTRQEAAVMVNNLLQLKSDMDIPLYFSNLAVWALDAMDVLVKYKIIEPDSNYYIDATSALTRAEVVVLLNNAIEANRNRDAYATQSTILDVNQLFKLSYNSNRFFLEGYSLLMGDKIVVTVPAKDSSNGESFKAIYTVSNFNIERSSIAYFKAYISNENVEFYPSSDIGALLIEVWRDDLLVVSGAYEYDMTKVIVEPMDASAYTLSILTTNDVIERDKNLNSSSKLAYSFKYSIDEAKFKAKHGQFAYYSEVMNYHFSDNIIFEDTKLLDAHQYKSVDNFSDNTKDIEHSLYFHPDSFDDGNGKYRFTHYLFEHVFFLYDEDKQFIKAVVLQVRIRDTHLGPDIYFDLSFQ